MTPTSPSATPGVPRGIRNHNPGNIKRGPAWRGLASYQGDAVFATFVEPIYGLRALAKLLTRYYVYYGLTSVTLIVSKYAPPSENDTRDYAAAVVKRVGFDEIGNGTFRTVLPALMRALVYFENGIDPYEQVQYEDALLLAGETT